MTEKKVKDTMPPENSTQIVDKMENVVNSKQIQDKMIPALDKSNPVLPIPTSAVVTNTPRISIPSFTKTTPNELYKKLLPAMLFVLTFVTVMTILLIYMDTVTLGAQQFRMNMSRDYDLARINQESPLLVAYVRQLHLSPKAPQPDPVPPQPTDRVGVLDQIFGEISNGTFIEFLPRGDRDPTTLYLERARNWDGVVVRAAPRDFLALKQRARALNSCLSPSPHPREITYHDSESHEAGGFSSRVLCLPLYTVVLAGEVAGAHYTVLGGDNVSAQLRYLPFSRAGLKVIEIRGTDPAFRNHTTEYLATKNYTVAATYDDAIMYVMKELTQKAL